MSAVYGTELGLVRVQGVQNRRLEPWQTQDPAPYRWLPSTQYGGRGGLLPPLATPYDGRCHRPRRRPQEPPAGQAPGDSQGLSPPAEKASAQDGLPWKDGWVRSSHTMANQWALPNQGQAVRFLR